MDSSQNKAQYGLLDDFEIPPTEGDFSAPLETASVTSPVQTPVAPDQRNFQESPSGAPPTQESPAQKQPTQEPQTQEPAQAQRREQTQSHEEMFYSQSPQAREEVLYEWKAPSRPFKRQSRQFYSTIGVIALLIGLILFFAGQIIPVAVVFAVVFLAYIMYSTPPAVVVHKITSDGIRIEDTLYYWEELGRFWFTKKYNEPLLLIETDHFPFRLTILLGTVKMEEMKFLLEAVLVNEQPPPTAYEKAAKWLQDKIPIDIES
jgi:hypothetical protein